MSCTVVPPPHTHFCGLLEAKAHYLCSGACVFIPATWRAGSAWTGGPSPAQMGTRCSGARTASLGGSGRTPWAGSLSVFFSRCSRRSKTGPGGRPRCPRRRSHSLTTWSNLREDKNKQKKTLLTPASRPPARQLMCQEASCQVQPCDSYKEGRGGGITKAELMLRKL